ncbi:uncharacterized protein EI90DRAFT_3035605 [Cantharellus anzutake]|uniref:uncharacterized protein n=1 Tax=Cantharellus anzutake TaxID=1750568 RepID=UPI0019082F8A|nr:uncharacterized protein EI90DRAFT_3035605 [Cantharellus anzutake]KAF8340455.1 hypothetical protein EI90DRAFT_3035605 [Cantharellus anzutake]
MSKPIAVDTPDGWIVTPISPPDGVGCEPSTPPLQIPTPLSRAYSAAFSTGPLVLSRNVPDDPHVTSTNSTASHSYYQELRSTLTENPASDYLRFFDHRLPWSATGDSIQSSCEPSHHRHQESFVPGTEEPTAKPVPSSLFHGNGSSYRKVDGEGKVVRAALDARHNKYLASSEAARFTPGPKELASLAHRFYPTVEGAGMCHAYITSVVRFRDNDAVRHRSLILAVARYGMPNFGLRIDRFRDHTLSWPDSPCTVTVSENSNLLHDVRSSEEARLELPRPVPLLEFGRVLEVVLIECGPYNVFAENCWFVVSMVEELFTEMFGARYVKGGARRSRLARQTRARIRSKLGLRDSE